MDFISWLVIAALFMLAEFGSGAFYLSAIGLACGYASVAAYHDASLGVQLAALSLGALAHAAIVTLIRRRRPAATADRQPSALGQRVEIIEWLDECSARVDYRGREWQADKAAAEMPDAAHGIIKAVQGNRLIITTE